MFSNMFRTVKALAVAFCAVMYADDAQSLQLNPEAIGVVGNFAETIEASMPPGKIKSIAGAIPHVTRGIEAFRKGEERAPFIPMALSIGLGAVGGTYGAAAAASAAFTVGLPVFAVAGAFLAGGYLAEKAGGELGEQLSRWAGLYGTQKNPAEQARPIAGEYPFEGVWVQEPNACDAITQKFSKNMIQTSDDPDNKCRIKKVTKKGDNEFVLNQECYDASGDGPKAWTPSVATITMQADGRFRMTSALFGPDALIYKRCAQMARPLVSASPSVPLSNQAPPQPVPPGSQVLKCNVNMGGKNANIEITLNPTAKIFSARIDNKVLVSQQSFEVLEQWGDRSMRPIVTGMKFKLGNGYMDYLVVNTSGQAFLSSWSSVTTRQAGRCN